MVTTLAAAELAIAMRMRDKGASWRKIGTYLHHEAATVRDTLVALGYAQDSRHRTEDTPANRQRAYQLYVVQGLLLSTTASKLHVGKKKARRWIVAEGGEMRQQHDTRVHGIRRAWGVGVACAIGAVMTGGRTRQPIGSFYCARECDWYEGKCGVEVTVQDRAGFEAFKSRWEEHERKRRADRKQPRARVAVYEYQIRGEENDDEFCESSPS